ncbi:hypothetical protein QQ008_25940 [Fulvivirgaceae bacterium BMA10]|uniref:Right handed beta helix domain-containing protein n=1 Tax=Splendidivirga corallicola TaxID=3051826 RepID=A0ABT8KVR0_9BACT|nr:hypothetical protein [Fulvivirgaceae bacterium BMA10]
MKKISPFIWMLTIHLISIDAYTKDFIVSSYGKKGKEVTGTIIDPFDAQYAFDGANGRIRPGDRILMRGGTYDPLVVRLSGSSQSIGTFPEWKGTQIHILPYDGERVIIESSAMGSKTTGIDKCLQIGDYDNGRFTGGEDVWVWNLEVTSANPNRIRTESGWVGATSGVWIYAKRCRLINCLVYDNPGVGVYSSVVGRESRIYGNIIFSNGYDDKDRGHGHNIYIQNEEGAGRKIVKHNILWKAANMGYQSYASFKTPSRGADISCIENISFNNGTISHTRKGVYQILVGGYSPVNNAEVDGNHVYNDNPGTGIKIGYSEQNTNTIYRNLVAKNNVIHNASFIVENPRDIRSFKNNKIIFVGTKMTLSHFDHYPLSATWDQNEYYDGIDKFQYRVLTSDPDGEAPWNHPVERKYYDFTEWRENLGIDRNAQYSADKPKNIVKIFKNEMELGRAHIVVHNFEGLDEAQIDLSAVLEKGQEYKLRDVQNLFGEVLISGKYNGSLLTVPLDLDVATPTKGNLRTISHTHRRFNVFLVEKMEK